MSWECTRPMSSSRWARACFSSALYMLSTALRDCKGDCLCPLGSATEPEVPSWDWLLSSKIRAKCEDG